MSYATYAADLARFSQELSKLLNHCTTYEVAQTTTSQYLAGLFASRQVDDFDYKVEFFSEDKIAVECYVMFGWDYYTTYTFTAEKHDPATVAYERAMTVV